MPKLPHKLQQALNSEYPDVDIYLDGWRHAIEEVLTCLLNEDDRCYLEHILDVLNGAVAIDG